MHRFEVVDHSMEPALLPGDFLVTTPGSPRRGDIAVFAHPNDDTTHLVKRVVGLGGETVTIRNGAVLVDDEPRDPAGDLLHTEPAGSWDVPTGRCFVLSDARTLTRADSRTFGSVPVGSLEIVRFRYWPVRRIGRGYELPG